MIDDLILLTEMDDVLREYFSDISEVFDMNLSSLDVIIADELSIGLYQDLWLTLDEDLFVILQ